MADVKVTKSDLFAEVRDLMVSAGRTDLADFAQKEIDALVAKAAKAKEKAAEKANEVDELKGVVASALTDTLQTGAEIFSAVDGDSVEHTLGKVRARLTALVKDGVAVKEETKVEVDGKTHTVMAYKLA